MYICYIDESGTPDIPGNTSHYVLAGLSIPIGYWKNCDRDVNDIKQSYQLESSEIHCGWLLRKYIEQGRIDGFENLPFYQRRHKVEEQRKRELLRLQRSGNNKLYKQTRKNYRKTEQYIHLTYDERKDFIRQIALCVSRWGYARLFAECVDKIFFSPSRAQLTVDEQAFQQVVSRFETFLRLINTSSTTKSYGLLIHDNNPTVAKKHTELMRQFLRSGTLWTQIDNIIETPLFVDSQLTSMVQIADLCGYALRRYLENNEDELFGVVFSRADRKDGTVVGVRHFTSLGCSCKICHAHG